MQVFILYTGFDTGYDSYYSDVIDVYVSSEAAEIAADVRRAAARDASDPDQDFWVETMTLKN